jgi:hypothetical protein
LREGTVIAIAKFLRAFDDEMGSGNMSHTGLVAGESGGDQAAGVTLRVIPEGGSHAPPSKAPSVRGSRMDLSVAVSTPAMVTTTSTTTINIGAAAASTDPFDAVVVDLMYEPGALLLAGSNEAVAYQRMSS